MLFIIDGHLCIELDRRGGVFFEVTVDMLDLGKMTLARSGTESKENDGSIHNIDTALGYGPFHLANTLPVLSLLHIVTDISNVDLRIVIGGHSSALLSRFKSEGILEVFHHALEVDIGAQCNNIFIGLRILDTLKVATK